MMQDFIQNTYWIPVAITAMGVILLALFIIRQRNNKSNHLTSRINVYAHSLLAVWAFIFLVLLFKENVFAGGRLNKAIFKAIWPLLLGLFLVSLSVFISKLRHHPAGLVASALLLVAGFFGFIEILKSYTS